MTQPARLTLRILAILTLLFALAEFGLAVTLGVLWQPGIGVGVSIRPEFTFLVHAMIAGGLFLVILSVLVVVTSAITRIVDDDSLHGDDDASSRPHDRY